MYIVGTFEHGIKLELALKNILNKGVDEEHIFCVPLNKRVQTKKNL